MTAKMSWTIFFLNLLLAWTVLAGPTGKIAGNITDKAAHEPLVAANVRIVGTVLGTTSDVQGNYVVANVPTGTYKIIVSYIGYASVTDSNVQVNADQTTPVNFVLDPASLKTGEVVVSAQASGQNQAINQQLAAPQIMDVVSSARIQELPDANAAESVGRLPGVSVLRSGGEGNQIVIRGLQPKYNAITIDGVRMASSNADDRSSDLSMISPYSLDGIDVIKVVTPDMDPDVIGGTVNFHMREAKGDVEGLRFGALGQAGYNGLSDAYDKYRNYKFVGSLEGRFLDDHSLGLFAQADIERRNLSSNEFGATYAEYENSNIDYVTTGLDLNDVLRDRQRENGTVVTDYKIPQGKILFSNFFSTGTTEDINRLEYFGNLTSAPEDNYSIDYTKSTLNLITNSLEVNDTLPVFHVTARLSHTYSETKDPNDWNIGFRTGDQNLNQFVNQANLYPNVIPPAAIMNPGGTDLDSVVLKNSFARERALTAALDFDASVDVPELDLSALFKFGGKFRHQTRSNQQQQSGGDGPGDASATYFDSLIASQFASTSRYAGTTNIPMTPYIDPGYNYGQFLGGDYPMVMPLNYSMLSTVASTIGKNAALITRRDAITWAYDQFNSETFNYTGYENQGGLYAMTTLNFGDAFSVIPGVRYQDLQTSYTAPQGTENTNSLHGGAYHSYWLPDVLVKLKPVSWFDLRGTYTNTLAYPDYNTIVPRVDVGTGGVIAWNNAQLNPTQSHNYDIYGSVYDNTVGLATVGGFLKKIDGLIYPVNLYVSGAAAEAYNPGRYAAGFNSSTLYNITTYVNLPNTINDYGLEADWQTHFWYLPYPFDGLVFNINYTHVYSNSDYPYVQFEKKAGSRVPVPVDTTFNAPLLYQPDKIVNMSLGYDYQDFSVRLSMIYQSDIYTGTAGPAVWLQLHTQTASYTRWDLSVKQNLPWLGMQVYGDINNLNSANDVSVIAAPTGVPNSQQSYGLTGDIGVRLRF
jgi:TonB-dependent receptor